MGLIIDPYAIRKPASVTHTDNAVSGSDLTTYTFSTQDIGAAATGRRVIVGAAGTAAATRTISSVTVGGNAATQVVFAEGIGGVGFIPIGLYIITVDAGTTADIVVTFSGGMLRAGVGVWAAYDLLSSTATDTATSMADPMNASIDCDGGGIIIGHAHQFVTGGAGNTFTWTNLTERFDETVEASGASYHTGASDAFAAGQSGLSITCDGSVAATTTGMALASFR